MKTILLTTFIIVSSFISFAQVIDDVELFNFSKQVGFTNLDIDGRTLYQKSDMVLFDNVVIDPDSEVIGFLSLKNPDLKIEDIYSNLVKLFGKETINKDHKPKGSSSDIYNLITLGKAKILRIWYIKQYEVTLDYNKSGIILTSQIRKKKL